MPAISVIMPVYNAEKYLRDAIDSVLQQTFTDFELILIDDGSKDGSGAICDEAAEKDRRVLVVHQQNRGMCASRNRAMQMACGEYIAFVDNDDDCHPDMLQVAYTAARETQADMIKYGRRAVCVQNGRFYNENIRNLWDAEFSGEQLPEAFLKLRSLGVLSPVWDGVYRRKFIEEQKLTFNEQLRFGEEDTIFCLQCYARMQKLAIRKGVYYHHYIRIGHSASSKFSKGTLDKHIVSANEEAMVYKQFGLDKKEPEKVTVDIVTRQHLLPVLISMMHPACDMTTVQKMQYLQGLKSQPGFAFPLSLQELKHCREGNARQRLVAILFAENRFRKLLFLAKAFQYYNTLKSRTKGVLSVAQ